MKRFHVKHLLAAILAAALCALALPANAQKMYRCPGASGGTTFSDTPCAGGRGGEISVKPTGGAAGSPPPKPDPQTRGAMDQRNAEYNAILSPECRRARQAFQAKAEQKGGMDELMKAGNPVSKAWEDCQFEAKDAIGKLSAKDQERATEDARKRNEESRMAQRQSECFAKQKVIDARRARLSQLTEAERNALRAVEQDVAINCR